MYFSVLNICLTHKIIPKQEVKGVKCFFETGSIKNYIHKNIGELS